MGAMRTEAADPVTGAPLGRRAVGEAEIRKAGEILRKYKSGRAMFEQRIVEDELWWELRHWETMRREREKRCGKEKRGPEPTSAWLFNAILNKHADAMDNYPQPVVLPRERSDIESAKTLSDILPVVMEYNNFRRTYSDAWWEKLKHGTAAYGVFWNSEKENGLGDIDIKLVDLLNIFWEPGINDIQKSRNLFILDLVDTDTLGELYPQYAGRLGRESAELAKYIYDDTVDTSEKSLVVDWYYKTQGADGRALLHYAKFCGDCLLYASENETEYAGRGYYDHGKYPVVLDVLFPEKGTPAGFGYVAICKDPQTYVDRLSANILESSMMSTKKRFFVSSSTGINPDEFLDWSKPLVQVEGQLDDTRVREIVTEPISGVYLDVMNMKIEEMKDTAANRDVNAGGTGSGVTAAAAIAALQEAGNKASRDMISASYQAYSEISSLCIELMRQFYDETRSFRITGRMPGEYTFVDFNNGAIQPQEMPGGVEMELFRVPVFDLDIRAQKKNPFSRMEENQRAIDLYGMGFFDPARAQEAMGALEMMDFEGIEQVRERVAQGQTMYTMLQEALAQLSELKGIPMQPEGVAQARAGAAPGGAASGGGQTGDIMEAQAPRTGYMQRLAERTRVKAEG